MSTNPDSRMAIPTKPKNAYDRYVDSASRDVSLKIPKTRHKRMAGPARYTNTRFSGRMFLNMTKSCKK